MKIDVTKISDIAKVEGKYNTDSTKPLFGFAVEDFVGSITRSITDGRVVGLLLEKDELQDYDNKQLQTLRLMVKTLKRSMIIIGFEADSVSNETLMSIMIDIHHMLSDEDFLELDSYEDRITAFNPKEFFGFICFDEEV